MLPEWKKIKSILKILIDKLTDKRPLGKLGVDGRPILESMLRKLVSIRELD